MFGRAALLALLLVSCKDRGEAAVAKTPPVTTVTLPPPPPPSDGGGPQLESRVLEGSPSEVAYLRDGTLVVTTDKEVVAVDSKGTLRRKAIGKDWTVRVDGPSHEEGITLEEQQDAVTLLSTPALTPLFAGKGRPLFTGAGVALDESSPVLLTQIDGKLSRFELGPNPPNARIEAVTFDQARRFALVSWSLADSDRRQAVIFDVASSRRIGSAVSMDTLGMANKATLHGSSQIAVEDGAVKIIDLATAKVLKSAKLACPKDSTLGNPMVNATGDVILVTCGMDGVVLDGRTLAVKRKIPRIIPGCDNGDILPARFDAAKPAELVVSGCGGEARLDVATGRYRCGDGRQLVGGEYELVPGQPARPLPADRLHLPACSQPSEDMTTGSPSGKYRFVMNPSSVTVRGAGATIALEDGASFPAFATDESRFAYLKPHGVTVRKLPEGTVLLELTSP
jgi:hypothetical protein